MRLLGNYLQQGAEGSFQEVAKYQNLLRPVTKIKVKKLLGNYLQEGAEGSFQEMTKYQNLQCAVAKAEVSQKLLSGGP